MALRSRIKFPYLSKKSIPFCVCVARFSYWSHNSVPQPIFAAVFVVCRSMSKILLARWQLSAESTLLTFNPQRLFASVVSIYFLASFQIFTTIFLRKHLKIHFSSILKISLSLKTLLITIFVYSTKIFKFLQAKNHFSRKIKRGISFH